MKTKLLMMGAVVLMLTACAENPPPGAGVVADVGYYDGYYDGYYGPFVDGYWGDDGAFWYADAGHNWHRDEGHHFSRTTMPGFTHVHGTGVHRLH